MLGFEKFAFSDKVQRDVTAYGDFADTVTFSGITNSGKPFKIVVWLDEVNRWANGESIQNCFNYLTAEQREILMTGNDDEAWEKMFGADE